MANTGIHHSDPPTQESLKATSDSSIFPIPIFSRQFYREHLKSFKLLLKSILAAGCDHLVITGDIVSTGEEEDYYLAREILGNLDLLNSDSSDSHSWQPRHLWGSTSGRRRLEFSTIYPQCGLRPTPGTLQVVFGETLEDSLSYGQDSSLPLRQEGRPLFNHRAEFDLAVVISKEPTGHQR